ncbi:MAG: hypothetical protein LH630_01250 [Actinomycetia bacterium]|nr:hypothetical protein [Actinomycetes bacterium]
MLSLVGDTVAVAVGVRDRVDAGIGPMHAKRTSGVAQRRVDCRQRAPGHVASELDLSTVGPGEERGGVESIRDGRAGGGRAGGRCTGGWRAGQGSGQGSGECRNGGQGDD